MFRFIMLLVLATSALAMDASYSPHRVLISTGSGFATHAVMLGSEPQPYSNNYPDIHQSTDRIDKFTYNLYWKENPPLTVAEAARLKVLEATVTNPTTELVYLQSKASKFLNQPVELDMQIYLILQVTLSDGSKDYSGTWVSLEKYELMADVANAPAPEPPYFPGLAINHVPQFVSVTEKNVILLPRSWRSRWQPVFLRGSYRGPAGNTGDITLKFRRHESVLMALGTLTSRDGKFSILSNATYNRQAGCDLPDLVNPPWTNYYNSTWTNWLGGYAIDYSQFKLTFANYGAQPFNPVLPEYNRAGDPLPCPACPEPPPCPPCTKAHVEDHPCPTPLPCTRPHVDDHPCQLPHLKDHTCPPCPRQHVEDPKPTPAPTPRPPPKETEGDDKSKDSGDKSGGEKSSDNKSTSDKKDN